MGLELTERSMPHSYEAEQAVLGSVLIDPACMRSVQAVISAHDFYFSQHQAIFGTMEALEAKNRRIDPLLVLDRLKADDVYDETGGRNYLFQIARSVPSTANVESYARIVKERSKARRAIVLTEEMAELFYATGASISEAQGKAGELLQLVSGTNQQKIFSSKQLFSRFFERMKEPVRRAESGIGWLDDKAQIDFGDYVIVGGRPSSGKTALTIQMMLDMAKKYKVAYFSLETNPDKLFERAVANRSGVELRTIKRHDLAEEEGSKESIAVAMENYVDEWIFHVISAAGMTVQEVRAHALQLQAQVIFVDYLSLLQQSGESLYARVTEISKGLHTLAQTTGITVIALSQLNRAGKEGPEMENLRESGQIEQDADVVLLISRPDEPNGRGQKVPSKDKRNLHIAKNKDGEAGCATKLRFDGPTQRFFAIDEERE